MSAPGRSADLCAFHLPRWGELPQIELYMDQLLGYVGQVLCPLANPENGELALTKGMVNNYVKQKVIPAPEKKRYGRRQIALLLVLCFLKQVFSIPECITLLSASLDEVSPQGYDRFCAEFEKALRASFVPLEPVAPPRDEMERLVWLLAGKLYFQKQIEWRQQRETSERRVRPKAR